MAPGTEQRTRSVSVFQFWASKIRPRAKIHQAICVLLVDKDLADDALMRRANSIKTILSAFPSYFGTVDRICNFVHDVGILVFFNEQLEIVRFHAPRSKEPRLFPTARLHDKFATKERLGERTYFIADIKIDWQSHRRLPVAWRVWTAARDRNPEPGSVGNQTRGQTVAEA